MDFTQVSCAALEGTTRDYVDLLVRAFRDDTSSHHLTH